MIEAPEIEHARLTAYLREHALTKPRPANYRKLILVHRLLTDLLDTGGGTPEQRAAVIRKLNE